MSPRVEYNLSEASRAEGPAPVGRDRGNRHCKAVEAVPQFRFQLLHCHLKEHELRRIESPSKTWMNLKPLLDAQDAISSKTTKKGARPLGRTEGKEEGRY